MTNEILIRKLERVVIDAENVIDRDSKKKIKLGTNGICLQKVRDEVFKVDKLMENCFKNNNTDTKAEYLGCISSADISVSNIFQNIINSGDCLKENKANRRKAMIYLATLFNLNEVRNCLENNSYFEIAGCIENIFGWKPLAPGIEKQVSNINKPTINKPTKKNKGKNKGKIKEKNKGKIKGKNKSNFKNNTQITPALTPNPTKVSPSGWVPISKFTT